MWSLNSLSILLILINITTNLISALNKNDTQNLSAQSLTSNIIINQNLKSNEKVYQPLLSQLNQQNQFILNPTNKLNQLSQLAQTKEISCNPNQTINFLKYSNRKLSTNFLNKLTEYTASKLLNQTASLYSKVYLDRFRHNLHLNKPITQLCYDACRSDLECLAFTINLKQSTCYLVNEDYKSNNNRDHLLYDTTNSWNFYEKVCFDKAQESSCNQIWSFDIHLNGILNNPSNSLQKQFAKTTTLEECLNYCWTNNNGTLNFKCRSINYDIRKTLCTLNQHNRRIVPEAYVLSENSMDNLVYAENHCTPFQGKCVFRNLNAYYLPDYQVYDVETNVNSVDQCEQLCINQSQYVCRAFAYSKQASLCKLSPEPSSNLMNSISTTSNRHANARRLEVLRSDKVQQQLIEKSNQKVTYAYYERTSCINVKIDCDANGMHTKVDTDGPFFGRLFTANNFDKCSKSNADSTLEQINITIPLDANECGTVAAGNGTFSNRLILQYHPLILKESDRRIEVSCDYHLIKQKVRGSKRRILEAGGLLSSSQVITGLAESPPVRLLILNEDKEEIHGARLGDTLYFKVELSDESVFGIFGSSLVAKSGNGNESLLLIDDHGCPLEPSIFPAVNVKSNSENSKSLSVPFQAFKFATDSSIKFQMTISFCLDSCAVITCDNLDLMKKRSLELTVNRRRRATNDKEFRTGDIVQDIKMETNFFIISDDENTINSDATLVADVKPVTQSTQVGTSLLVTKAKQHHSQIVGDGKVESYVNYPQSSFNFSERVCFSPVLVYLFALLALIAQLLLMFFCTWILFSNIKHRTHHTSRVNSRQSSEITTSDLQSIYSLRTGSSTLKNYYTNSNMTESLDHLGGLNKDLNKLNWNKDAQWPIKLNKSSKLYSSNLASMFNNGKDEFFK